MFYPEAMTEIELIVPAKDLLNVTKVLSNEGVFQQADNSYLGLSNEQKDATWHERAGTYASLERRIQAIMQALEMDEGNPPSMEFESMADLKTVQPEVDRIEQDVHGVTDQLAAEQKRVEQLNATMAQLEPLSEVNIDISELRHPRYLFSALGTMPNENIERLQTSIARIPHVFLNLRQERDRSVVWLAGAKKNADILDRAARSAYINTISLPEDYHGTPSQILQTLHSSIAQANEKIASLKADLQQMCATHEQELQSLLWKVRTSRMMADAIVRFGKLQYTYLIVGWAPSSRVGELNTRIKAVSKETLIEMRPLARAEAHGEVPVALGNPRIMKPFQTLVTTYARPQYNEIDPTFLIALTFPLLFGAMFGDLGQGAVLAVLGWLLANKKIKALNSLSPLGGLITACGISAMIFGLLYGSVFGFEDKLKPLWMNPMENILTLLIIAVAAGVVLLTAGFVIGMVNSFVKRDWANLFFDRNGLAGFILYWSFLLIIFSIFTKETILPMVVLVVLFAISGLVIALSEIFKRLVEGHRPLITEGIGTFIIQAFFELFETVISFLSNSLSYVRVGAFAVAHVGLSSVFFILGQMIDPGHTIGYWIMIVIGNIFIIGFEGLIVGIQTMRLEYYEFFSKFFKGGGTTYQPLTIRPTGNE